MLLCQRSEEYNQFILSRLGQMCSPLTLAPVRETALRGGPFNSGVRELLSYYITLEEYFMEVCAYIGMQSDCRCINPAPSMDTPISFWCT